MAAPSFNSAPGEDNTTATARRRLAMALLQKSMGDEPIRHWAQGAARMGQALMGGLMLRRDDEEATANDKAKAGTMADIIERRAAPAAASATPSAAGPGSASGTNGFDRIYRNDEPSPLDPPSGTDRDMLARTVLAEAGNQGPIGMQAVASVARNRAAGGNFGGDTIPSVLQKPYQFEPHNTPEGRARMAGIDPNSPQYRHASAAIERAYAGDDPTAGATHFYAPKAQAALGRPAPKWDDGTGRDIGDHRFFGAGGTAPGQSRMPPAVDAAPSQPDMRAKAVALLRSSSKAERELGQKIFGAIVQADMSSGAQFTQISEDGYGGKRYGFVDTARKQVTPFDAPGAGASAPWEPTAKLRGEVRQLPSYKNLAEAAPIYETMLQAAGRNTKASDLNLVYGLGKIFDPGSVVREGEMVMVKSTASLPDWLVGTINSLNGGAALTPATRDAIMREAHGRVTAYHQMFDRDAVQYRGIAQRGRMNLADVLPTFGPFEPFRAPPSATPAPIDDPRAEQRRKYGLPQ